MTDEQYYAIMDELAAIKAQTRPKSSAASISGFQGGTVVKQPYVEPKAYEALLKSADGDLFKVAKYIRQRVDGFKDSSYSIVGTMDQKPEEKAAKDQFMADFPGLFGESYK